MSNFSTFGFLNPFVQSKWKERAKKADEERKRIEEAARKDASK